jgi:RNA polymerase sigma-70 factor (family 1)
MPLQPVNDDLYLFARIAEGDEGAFGRVFEKYRHRLYVVAIKSLHVPEMAEEVVQDIFLSLWVSREKLGDVEDPGGYLFTMTFNRVSSWMRKVAWDGELRRELKRRYQEAYHGTEETVDVRERERLVREAVERLPEQRKKIYKLAKEEGMSYQEIAEELGVSVHTVRNQMAEAIKQVRMYVGERMVWLVVVAGWLMR